MSSVKKDNINKHFHSLLDCCESPRASTCARWAGPAALRSGAGELGSWRAMACSNQVHFISGGVGATLHGGHVKKKTKNKKPEKTKTSNQNPHNPTI